jgi:hypothetical protein
MQATEIGKVFKTDNLGQFQKIEGNRDLDHVHLSRLRESIRSDNRLSAAPIIVNEKLEVIDGQHRLAAARELGLEIYFIIVVGADRDSMIVLNQNVQNWKPRDFAEYWVRKGHEGYKVYLEFIKQYGLEHQIIMCLFSDFRGSSGSTVRAFRAGEFSPDGKQVEWAHEQARMLFDLGQFHDRYLRRTFVLAATNMFNTIGYDHQHMISRLAAQPTSLVPCVTAEAYLQILENIFNYNLKKSRVYFNGRR